MLLFKVMVENVSFKICKVITLKGSIIEGIFIRNSYINVLVAVILRSSKKLVRKR